MNDQISRAHIAALNSQVNQYRASEDYCDVEIYVEGRAFKCHRLILAAASEYFHIMFGGKFKESTASLVTLQEVEPATFGEILQFIYTGNLTINNTNLFKLVRASEFFKIPHLQELCVWYVEQNEHVLIENGLEMLSYVRAAGNTSFGKFLGQRINKYFDYFSKTPEFLQMSLDDFISILDLIPLSRTVLQDTFIFAIIRWIRHTDHSPQASLRSHFQELLKRISFAKLSSNCVEYLKRTNFQNDIAFEEIAKTDETRSCLYATDSALEELVDFDCFYVYVRAFSGDMLESFVNVFSLYKHLDEYKWYHTYQYDSEYNPIFTRTVVLDHHLYSLSVRESIVNPEIRQTFKKSSSISLFPDSYLKPPPLIMEEYDMCGSDDHIYVYNKNGLFNNIEKPYASSFSDEELSRGCFVYNREVDTWLPLPLPKRKLAYSSMTCDRERVYLIGGTDPDNLVYMGQRYVQSYDPRTSEWISLQPTHGAFECSACCAHQGKIYVSGGYVNPTAVELYDPRREQWEKLQPMNQDRNGHRMEPYIYSTRSLVAVGRSLSPNSVMEIYDTAENKWKMYDTPSLNMAVKDAYLEFKGHLEIIDTVTYKPIGL